MTGAPRKLRIRVGALPLTTLLLIVTGLALRAGPFASQAHLLWLAGLCATGLPVVWRTIRGVLTGRFAADLVATLAIITAILLDQPLPGLIVVLMQTGGEALEQYAAGRASDAVRELEAAAPRVAHLLIGEQVQDVSAEAVSIGDRLLVRPGEMVPCDGVVESGHSHVDASRLTGEPIPVRVEAGIALMSGSLNQDSPFVLTATAVAQESQYARIVRLVREATATKSPLLRMADRYAVWFTPLTLLVCSAAWLISHDSARVLAVLVVATPCPLILAAPVAMIGGINQAARHNVVVRHGEALERLGNVTTAVFDKTGTLTVGHPSVSNVTSFGSFDEDTILRLAASVELGSGHPLARPVVTAAEKASLTLAPAESVVEQAGQGVTGLVAGRRVAVGALSYLDRQQPGMAANVPESERAGLRAWVLIDGRLAGAIDYADRLRPDLHVMLDRLASLGINRTVLLTGDHVAHADRVARQLGIQEVQADLLPADKLAVVDALEREGRRVVMLGDGTNDAPALRRATVGVALAAHGGGISAEAADAVILADDPSRLADAIEISQRTMTIAKQSVWAGLGLTGVAMVIAALGHIPPTAGAVLQEIIDIAVILNALRASAEGSRANRRFIMPSSHAPSVTPQPLGRTVLHMIALIAFAQMFPVSIVLGQSGASRPPEVTDSSVAEGRRIFQGVGGCFGCHGMEGGGTDSGAPLAQGVWMHGADTWRAIRLRVLHGIPRDESTRGTTMPIRGVSELTDSQVDAVTSYVWVISHQAMRPKPKP